MDTIKKRTLGDDLRDFRKGLIDNKYNTPEPREYLFKVKPSDGVVRRNTNITDSKENEVISPNLGIIPSNAPTTQANNKVKVNNQLPTKEELNTTTQKALSGELNVETENSKNEKNRINLLPTDKSVAGATKSSDKDNSSAKEMSYVTPRPTLDNLYYQLSLENKYANYSYAQLKDSALNTSNEKESKWLNNKADSIASSNDYKEELQKLKDSYNQIARTKGLLDYDNAIASGNSHGIWADDNIKKQIEDVEHKLNVRTEEENEDKYFKSLIDNDVRIGTIVQKYYNLMQYNNTDGDNKSGIMNQDEAVAHPEIINLSSDERNKIISDFNNLKKQGIDTDNLYKYYSRYHERQVYLDDLEKQKELANKAPVMSSIGTVIGNTVGSISDAGKYIGAGIDKAHGGDGYINSDATNVKRAQEIRNTVSEKIGKNIDDKTVAGIAQFLYNTGMSMADFGSTAILSAVPGGQAVGLAMLSTSAGVSAANEVVENGGTIDKAISTGVFAGIAEALFEKVSLEQLKVFSSQNNVKSVKDLLKNVVKGAFTEGSEEVATDLANALTDRIVNGDYSSLSLEYKKYIDEGYSEAEAKQKVALNFASQIGQDFAGGALSGGVLGSAASSLGLAKYKINAQQESNIIGKALLAEEDFNVDEFLDEAVNSGNKKAKHIAEETKKNIQRYGFDNVSTTDLGNIYKLMLQEQNAKVDNATSVNNNNSPVNDNNSVSNQRKTQTVQNTKNKTTESVSSDSIDTSNIKNEFGTKHSNGLSAIDYSGSKTENIGVVSIASSEKTYNGNDNTVMLITQDGRKIDAHKVVFNNPTYNKLMNAAYNFETEGAKALVKNYEIYEEFASKRGEVSLEDYSHAFEDMYNAGKTGTTLKALSNIRIYNNIINRIGAVSAQAAVTAGYKDSNLNLTRSAEKVQRVKLENGRASKVTVANGVKTNLSNEHLNVLQAIATKTNREIVITDKLGAGENGLYSNGKIYINADINNNYMISVALHESIHSMKEAHLESYIALRDFVFNYYAEAGYNINDIRDDISNKWGNKVSDDADIDEEVVAQAVMALASNEDALQQAISTKENQSLLVKVLEAIKNIAQGVRDFISGITTGQKHNLQAQAFIKDLEALDKMAELVSAGLEKSSTVAVDYNSRQKNNTHVGMKASVEDNVDYSYPENLDEEQLKHYNDRGWASNLFDSEDKRLLEEKYDEIFRQGKSADYGFSDGAVLVEVNNKMAVISGTRQNPKIDAVIVINADNETEAEIIKEEIYYDQTKNFYSKDRFTNSWRVFSESSSEAPFRTYIESDFQYHKGFKEAPAPATLPDSFKTYGYYKDKQNRKAGTGEAQRGVSKSAVDDVIEENRDLVAVHNLSADNLLNQIKEFDGKGIPVPSIAITKSNMLHSNFGEISLIFDKNTVDPQANRDNEVFNRDAWTSQFPETEYKVDMDKLISLAKKLGESASMLSENEFKRPKDFNHVVDKLAKNKRVQESFVKDNNIKVTPVVKVQESTVQYNKSENVKKFLMRDDVTVRNLIDNENLLNEYLDLIAEYKTTNRFSEGLKNKYIKSFKEDIETAKSDEYVFDVLSAVFDNEKALAKGKQKIDYDEGLRNAIEEHKSEFETYCKDLAEPIIGDKYIIRNDVEPYKSNGDRKSFDALHYAYTIENVVKSMQKGKSNTGSFLGGASRVKSAFAKQYNSIDEIKSNKDKISGRDEQLEESVHEPLKTVIYEIAESSKHNEDFTVASENVIDALKSRKTVNGVYNYLKQYYENLSKDTVSKLFDVMEQIDNLPVDYFEAKPHRAVGFDEVKAVVVPDNISKELRTSLENLGLTLYEYITDNEQSRAYATQNAIENTSYTDVNGDFHSDLRFAIDDTINDWIDESDLWDDNDNIRTTAVERSIQESPELTATKLLKGCTIRTEQRLKANRKIHLDDKAYKRIASAIMSEYRMQGDKSADRKKFLANTIKDFVEQVQSGKYTSFDVALSDFVDECHAYITIYSSGLAYEQEEERDYVLKYLKHGDLVIPRDAESSIKEYYGSIKNYRQKLFGKVNVITENNYKGKNRIYLSDLIAEWNQEGYGYLIDDESEWDSPEGYRLLEELINGKLNPVIRNPYIEGDYYENIDSASVDMAFKTVSLVFDEQAKIAVKNEKIDKQTRNNAVKAKNQALNEQKERAKAKAENYKNLYEEERSKRIEQIKKMRNNLNNIKERSANTRKAQQEKIKQLESSLDDKKKIIRNEFSSIREQYWEERRTQDYVERIRKLQKKFAKLATNPDDNNFALPVFMNSGFLEAAKLITDAVNTGNTTKASESLGVISSIISDLMKNDKNHLLADEFDDDFSKRVYELRLLLENKEIRRKTAKNVRGLTLDEAEDIYNILNCMIETVRDANKLLASEEQATITDCGAQIIEEQENLDVSFLNKFLHGVKNYFLTPERMSNIFNGFNDEAVLSKQMVIISEGQRNKNIFFMESNKMFSDYTENHLKEYYDSVHKVVTVEYKDNTNKTQSVKITRQQGMQILMSWTREQLDTKLQHISTGGITILDADYLAKDNYRKALDNSKTIIGINHSFIAAVQSQMTEFEEQYIKIAEEFFNNKAKNAINSVTRVLKHRDTATSKYYIPFSVDENTVKLELDGIKSDVSMLSKGMLKTTVINDEKPLMITGLNQVVEHHIKEVSDIYGLAIPIRDLQKILNVNIVEKSKSGTSFNNVRDAFEKNWGKRGIMVYEQLITDLTVYPRRTQGQYFKGLDSLIKKVRSNFVSSTLTANPSVVMKQAASYSCAQAYLDAGSLEKGKLMFGRDIATIGWKALCDEIDSHTAQHYMRRVGLSSDIVSDINNNWFSKQQAKIIANHEKLQNIPQGANPKNWIQEMDCATTAALWCATKAQINKNYKVENKSINTEEYWNDVTQLYDKVIENTQPMYDPLHRPEILKTSNETVKSIFMFKTQPLQNANIIYDAVGRLSNENNAENRKILVKATLSQARSLMVFAGMTLAILALQHRMDRYKDDDDEVTAQSIAWQYLSDMLSNGAGLLLPFGGTEITTEIISLAEGNGFTLDLFSDSVVDSLNDLGSSFAKFSTTVFEEFEKSQNGEQIDGKKIFKATEKMLENVLGMFTGFPLHNVYNMINGGIMWGQEFASAGEDSPFNFNSVGLGEKKSYNSEIKSITEAMKNGDKNKADMFEKSLKEQLKADGKSDSQAYDYIKKEISEYLAKNDDDIKHAAIDKLNGKYNDYENRLNTVAGYGYDSKDVKKAIDNAIDNIKSDMNSKGIRTEKDVVRYLEGLGINKSAAEKLYKNWFASAEPEKEVGSVYDDTSDSGVAYNYNDAFSAISSADYDSYEHIKKYIIENRAEGKSAKDAEKAFNNAMKSSSRVKPLFDEYIEVTSGKNQNGKRAKEVKDILTKIYGTWNTAYTKLKEYQKTLS